MKFYTLYTASLSLDGTGRSWTMPAEMPGDPSSRELGPPFDTQMPNRGSTGRDGVLPAAAAAARPVGAAQRRALHPDHARGESPLGKQGRRPAVRLPLSAA